MYSIMSYWPKEVVYIGIGNAIVKSAGNGESLVDVQLEENGTVSVTSKSKNYVHHFTVPCSAMELQ